MRVLFVERARRRARPSRPTLASDVLERGAVERRIDRNDRGARAHDAEVRDRPVGVVLRREDDAIALRDAERREPRRHRVATRAHVVERDARDRPSFSKLLKRERETVALRHLVDERDERLVRRSGFGSASCALSISGMIHFSIAGMWMFTCSRPSRSPRASSAASVVLCRQTRVRARARSRTRTGRACCPRTARRGGGFRDTLLALRRRRRARFAAGFAIGGGVSACSGDGHRARGARERGRAELLDRVHRRDRGLEVRLHEVERAGCRPSSAECLRLYRPTELAEARRACTGSRRCAPSW